MKRYIISFLYFIPLYYFWCGVILVLFELKPPSGALAFVSGFFFVYPIANIAEKKGYSWWKHFLLFGFLSTGIPIVGIIKLVQINKVKNNHIKISNFKDSIDEKESLQNNNIYNKTDMEIWIEKYYNGTSIQKEKYLIEIKNKPIKWIGNVEDVKKSSIKVNDKLLEGILISTIYKEYKIIFLIQENDDIYNINLNQNIYEENYNEIYEIEKNIFLINNLIKKEKLKNISCENKLEEILDEKFILEVKKLRRIYGKNVYIDHLKNILIEKNINDNIIEEIIKNEYDNC